MPDVHSVHKGKVVRVETYGCFVEITGFSKWGLVHVSQLADSSGKGGMKIETKDVVDVGDEVWVKVCDVEPEAGKISFQALLRLY
jgi:predicted RNA-binding protein with RPS1 domain